MFSPALSRHGPNAFSSTYRQVGIETGASTASPHQLILMLFEGFQESLAQAKGAIAANNRETKSKAITRAMRIINEGLRGALNLDAGGGLAADLDALYGYITVRLSHASIQNDTKSLDECRDLMEPIRTAWIAIGGRVEGNQ
jgi:flagellar secretion chaperone FliS